MHRVGFAEGRALQELGGLVVLSSVNSYCPSRRKTEGGAPPRRQSTSIALVSTQAVPKEAIQNAIMEQQGRCTPMEALESITFSQEGRITAQLSCSLTMKGWKHVAVIHPRVKIPRELSRGLDIKMSSNPFACQDVKISATSHMLLRRGLGESSLRGNCLSSFPL